LAEIDFSDKNYNLQIIAVHLESAGHRDKTRKKQLEFLYKQLTGPNQIVLGDFNFESDNENETFLKAGFVDMWMQIKKTPKGGETWGMNRLDRITYKTKNWIGKDIKVIGGERVPTKTQDPPKEKEEIPRVGTIKKVSISDHLGVFCNILPKLEIPL